MSEEPQKNQDPATSGDGQGLGETRRRSRLRWKKKDMPGGLWVKCDACSQTIYRKDLEDNDLVCPHCSFHFTVTGSETAARMAATPSATRSGRAMRQAPNCPLWTRSLGHPTFRFTSS